MNVGHYISFLLQCVCQIAVGIGEVGLQLNGPPVGVDGQVDESLFVVDAGQVSVNHCMVGAQTQSSQVSSDSSEDATRKTRNVHNYSSRYSPEAIKGTTV